MDNTDLLGYLYNRWKETETKSTKAVDFVEFAKKYLLAHPPATFDYRSLGYGLTFSDGSRVSFLPEGHVPGQYQQDLNLYAGEVAVTGTNRDPMPFGPGYGIKI